MFCFFPVAWGTIATITGTPPVDVMVARLACGPDRKSAVVIAAESATLHGCERLAAEPAALQGRETVVKSQR